MSQPFITRDDRLASSLVDDWLGLARYLAEAVDTDQLDGSMAEAELGTAVDVADLAALGRALDRATECYGEASTPARLLQTAFVGSLNERVA
jgi:hypothetical protein